MRSMALTASAESLMATQSTYSSVASISARNSALNTGRPGPLLTKRSAVTVTISTSPSLRAASRWRTWPRCKRSNVPWAWTTVWPARRACSQAAATSAKVRTLWRGLGARPTGGCGISFATLESIAVLLRHWLRHWLGIEKAEPIAGRFGNARCRPHRRVAPIVDVLQHHLHALGKADLGLPSEVALDLGNVGPSAIRFSGAFGDAHGRRRPQKPDQLVDADRPPAPNIVDFADFVTLGDRDQRIDHVGHEGKIPGLLAVADHGQRLPGQQLSQENTEHRAISPAGARAGPINVEETHRHRRQPVDLGPMHDELLAQIFGQGVGVARIGRGGFSRRIVRRDAVAGRGGDIDQALDAVAAGRLQHAKGAVHVGAEIGLRLLDRGHDVGAGGKMEHPLGAGGRGCHGGGIGDIAFDDRQVRIPVMMLEVSAPADDKRVERAHRAALRQQAVDEVAADKTGAARHQVDSCRRCLLPSSVGRELMRSKAANFKHRWPAAKNRVPQGFCRRVFWGY